MKFGKITMKFFILLIVSLTLTAGYAQALPDIGSYSFRSASVSSYYNLISSTFSHIFGNSHTDFLPFNYEISSAKAIEIAKGKFPGIVLTSPVRTKLSGGVWTITLHGYYEEVPESGVRDPAGGEVKIDARTGEIVSIRRIM